MDVTKSIDLLDQAAATINTTRAVHIELQKATKTIKDYVAVAELAKQQKTAK